MKLYIVICYACDRESDPGASVVGVFSSMDLAKEKTIANIIDCHEKMDTFIFKNTQYFSSKYEKCYKIIETILDQ